MEADDEIVFVTASRFPFLRVHNKLFEVKVVPSLSFLKNGIPDFFGEKYIIDSHLLETRL